MELEKVEFMEACKGQKLIFAKIANNDKKYQIEIALCEEPEFITDEYLIALLEAAINEFNEFAKENNLKWKE